MPSSGGRACALTLAQSIPHSMPQWLNQLLNGSINASFRHVAWVIGSIIHLGAVNLLGGCGFLPSTYYETAFSPEVELLGSWASGLIPLGWALFYLIKLFPPVRFSIWGKGHQSLESEARGIKGVSLWRGGFTTFYFWGFFYFLFIYSHPTDNEI